MMKSIETDYAVLGGGIAGCATAYYLARLGVHSGVLLEAGTFGAGASAKSAAMIMAQTLDPVLTAMSVFSMGEYKRIEKESSNAVTINRCGSALYTTDASKVPNLYKAVAEQIECGVASEVMNREEFGSRYPQIKCDDFQGVAYCQTDGYMDQWALLQYYVESARAAGFKFQDFFPVRGIAFEEGRFQIMSNVGNVAAKRLVLATGRNAPLFAKMLGIRLKVSWNRRQIVIFKYKMNIEPFPIMESIDDQWYFRPHGYDRILVGVGPTHEAETPDVDGLVDESHDRATAQAAREYVCRRLPFMEEALVPAHWSGVRGLTDDERPIIGASEEVPGLYYCCGLSAFGITLSAVSGFLAASLATGKKIPAGLTKILNDVSPARCIVP